MYCMNCGTKLPDGAKFCMNCGSAVNSNSRSLDTPQKREKVVEEKEEKIVFEIVDNWKISCNKKLGQFASLFGEFLNRAYEEAYKLFDEYDSCGTIENVLQHIPDMAQEAIDDVIRECLKILYDLNINMSAKQFIDKYYYEFQIDYEPYYKTAIDQFAEIMQNKQALEAFRVAQRESRSRWQGGGFGVSGAIKGAVTASVMNIGMDFVRSFGDSVTNRSDNAHINGDLIRLYKNKKIRSEMCWGVYWCIKNAYSALMKELSSRKLLETCELDENGAKILFENAGQFANNREEYVGKVMECILKYPGDRRYYDAIMPEILSHEGDDFERFLKFWNIEFLGDEYRKKKKEEQDNIVKQKQALEQQKTEIDRAQLFDTLFDSYKATYEKENGRITEIVPNVYYKFIRPCLHEYCIQTGVYEESNKLIILDLAFGFDDDIDYIPEGAVRKKQLNDYLLYIRKINRDGGFTGEEYINSMPKFIDVRSFVCCKIKLPKVAK